MSLERVAAVSGTASGTASVLGAWQVCHALCMAAVAALAALGVTVVGMPFLFLAEYVVPIWLVAAFLLAVTAGLYAWKRCVSRGMLVLNAGLVIAGVPFLPGAQALFWIVGGLIAVLGAGLLVRDRRSKKEACCHG